MQPAELRLGNWVKMADDAVSSSEYPGTVFQWDMAHFTDLETCHLYIDAIEPIPITEEILLKCGFEDAGVNDLSYSFRSNEGDITYDLDDNSIRISDTWQYGKRLYLHELQNLFHALMQKELIYTP